MEAGPITKLITFPVVVLLELLLTSSFLFFFILSGTPPKTNEDGTPYRRTQRQHSLDEWFYEYRHWIVFVVFILGWMFGFLLLDILVRITGRHF
jgi:hypothetical protein